MRQLIVRFLNVAVIAAVLIGYNTVLDKRDKEDQIARLSAELETTQLQKENLQAAAAASNTADTAASEAAEAEGQLSLIHISEPTRLRHPTRRIRPQVKQQKQKGSMWTAGMMVRLTASAAPLQLK